MQENQLEADKALTLEALKAKYKDVAFNSKTTKKAFLETIYPELLEAEEGLEESPAEKKAKAKAEHAERLAKAIEAAKSGAPESEYLPEVKERHLYHVELEVPHFSAKTGKQLSVPYVQKFTKPEYGALEKHREGMGLTAKVFWNPTLYK